jgi:hypothetical protein
MAGIARVGVLSTLLPPTSLGIDYALWAQSSYNKQREYDRRERGGRLEFHLSASSFRNYLLFNSINKYRLFIYYK